MKSLWSVVPVILAGFLLGACASPQNAVPRAAGALVSDADAAGGGESSAPASYASDVAAASKAADGRKGRAEPGAAKDAKPGLVVDAGVFMPGIGEAKRLLEPGGRVRLLLPVDKADVEWHEDSEGRIWMSLPEWR